MIVVSAICDKCGKMVSYKQTRKPPIQARLYEEGWMLEEKDLCPKCRKKRGDRK